MRMPKPGPGGQANAVPWWRWLLPAAILAGFLALLAVPRGAPAMPLAYSRFTADVAAGSVRAVSIGPAGQVSGSLTGGQPFSTTIPVALGGDGLARDLAAHHVRVTATAATGSSPLLSALTGLLPLLLIGGLLYILFRGARRQAGGMGHLTSLTKARARVIDAERLATRFPDVAGYPAVKTEVSEVVDYLRDPGRYHRAGARGPRGVLMSGPPGTGKTLLARAVAGEARVPFFSVSGSGFVEMFVGVGAARVRDLFDQARTRAPAIVFIDEIDALGSRRDHGGYPGNDEREQTLNQLLAEMDGFDPSAGVVVLAATNRPDAANLAARLLGHAIYAPAACAGWMHADLHPGNFILLPGGRLGMLDFGAVAATPGGIPAPFGQLAAAVLAADGQRAISLARQVGALPADAAVDPRMIVELLDPIVATAAADSFTYSRPWLRRLMTHLTAPRFAPAVRKLTPPPEYALVWRATLSAAGLFAQLGATVPTRGFHLAYSPGFRGTAPAARPRQAAGPGSGLPR